MGIIKEYRIVLPFSTEEYRIAQLYMVAKLSARESDGESGVEILKNEPFENEKGLKGQYTSKVYHLNSKLPYWVASLVPSKALVLREEAWNAYPYCKTVLTSPYFSKFKLEIETMHLEDRGQNANALNMNREELEVVEVEQLDITEACDGNADPNPNDDPSQFKSKLTGRGPLANGWMDTCEPVMTAYKLVRVDIPYWGFGSKMEKYIARTFQRRMYLESNRQAFCCMDEWFHLTMDDIRKMEKDIFEKINMQRDKKQTENGSGNHSASNIFGSNKKQEKKESKEKMPFQAT